MKPMIIYKKMIKAKTKKEILFILKKIRCEKEKVL